MELELLEMKRTKEGLWVTSEPQFERDAVLVAEIFRTKSFPRI